MGTYGHNCDGRALEALRRIDSLEADRRRVERSLSRCLPGSPLAAELARQRDELDARLTHWRGVVARAEAAGFRAWGREDFARGDFVEYHSVWYEVVKVNARSVSVPHGPGGTGNVVRRSDVRPGWTWTIGYHDGITGRMSAEEMDGRECGA